MAIWLLQPAVDDPKFPWYNKSMGFVVRAESESDARILAARFAEKSCIWHDGRPADAPDWPLGESHMGGYPWPFPQTDDEFAREDQDYALKWLDPEWVLCFPIPEHGPQAIILEANRGS